MRKSFCFLVLSLCCDGHKDGMLYSVCGMGPSGAKFFLPIGVKPYGEFKTAHDIFEMAKSVFFLKCFSKF